jgi:ABC-2 type transport system permease protein
MKGLFSPGRLLAMIVKELIQMRRDRMTFAIMFGLPIVQILLFGFVINSDPRHLPTAALLADNGPEGRTLLQGLKNSTYFDFVRLVGTEQEGRSLLTRGEVQFVINIPQNFSHDLLRGDKPAILLEADATDPIATSGGAGALANIVDTAFQSDFVGPLEFLVPAARSIDIRVHSLYNPEAITSYNIVPGLMGVVLTMTLVMVTALAIAREYERGPMEYLD